MLSVFCGGNRYQKWADMHVTDQEWENLKSLNQELQERIVECARDEHGRPEGQAHGLPSANDQGGKF